jgi:hypothetical protein
MSEKLAIPCIDAPERQRVATPTKIVCPLGKRTTSRGNFCEKC